MVEFGNSVRSRSSRPDPLYPRCLISTHSNLTGASHHHSRSFARACTQLVATSKRLQKRYPSAKSLLTPSICGRKELELGPAKPLGWTAPHTKATYSFHRPLFPLDSVIGSIASVSKMATCIGLWQVNVLTKRELSCFDSHHDPQAQAGQQLAVAIFLGRAVAPTTEHTPI